MLTRIGAGAALASFICASAPACAVVANPCSSESFSIDGAALTVRVCDVVQPVGGSQPRRQRPASNDGELQETLSVDGRPPIVRTVRYERSANEEAHALDDVPLQSLGIARTLHVVLAVRGGSARLEHALLVPGAVSLK